MIDTVKRAVSDLPMVLGLVLAIFLLWLGAVISGMSDDNDIEKAGTLVASFGMLLITIVLFVGGLVRSDMDMWVRVALIISAVLLVAWVGFWPQEISLDWPLG